MPTLTPKSKSILDDLKQLDFANPVLDKRIVEECFVEHLRLLGLLMLPVHWISGPKEGDSYIKRKKSEENVAWKEALSKARNAMYHDYNSLIKPADVIHSISLIKPRDVINSMPWLLAQGIEYDWQRRFITRNSLEDVVNSAVFLNSNDSAAIAYGNILFPFVEAVKAGLHFYYVTEDEIICCPAPKITIKNKQLHNETGSAVSWSNGEAYYFYKGVNVTKEIIEKKFSWNEIEAEKNQEVRRVMLDIYGSERYIKESGMTATHVDDFGTLYKKSRKDGSTFTAVKVVNSTPEPDGSFKDYFIRVNPKLYDGDAGKIAHAAVASMWRTKGGKLAFKRWQEYCPAYET